MSNDTFDRIEAAKAGPERHPPEASNEDRPALIESERQLPCILLPLSFSKSLPQIDEVDEKVLQVESQQQSKPFGVPPTHWPVVFPAHWRVPPPHEGFAFSDKQKRERLKAIEHRFESYPDMWKRLYELAEAKETETSKLLEESANLAKSSKDGFVIQRIKRIRVVFSEHTENEIDAMDGVRLMLQLEDEHKQRPSELWESLRKVCHAMRDCMTFRIQKKCQIGDEKTYKQLLKEAWRCDVPLLENSHFHQSYKKQIYANFWYAFKSKSKTQYEHRGYSRPRRIGRCTHRPGGNSVENVSHPPGLSLSSESSSDERFQHSLTPAVPDNYWSQKVCLSEVCPQGVCPEQVWWSSQFGFASPLSENYSRVAFFYPPGLSLQLSDH